MSLIHLPIDQWLDNVALGALSSRETVQASYDIARLAIQNGVPGDFVECGVYGGAQCAAMARAIMDPAHYWDENRESANALGQSWPPRRVHLFDSFTGVPAAGPHDAGWTHEPGVSTCSLDACKDHMREWGIPNELLVWHPGMFDESVNWAVHKYHPISERVVREIAVLRLDADLYESTRVCMEHLYPLVSPGGWVIVDDFALDGARKAVMETVVPSPCYFQKHS